MSQIEENKQQLNKNLPAALYSRVSTEEQKQGKTIKAHIEELKKQMIGEGNFLWNKERGIYPDEGWSGEVLARPELDRLRDDAQKGLFSVVYFLHPDRVARENHYIGIVINELRELGIKVIFKNLPLEDSPTGNFLLNIFGSYAQYEKTRIAERTRRGRRYKAEVKKLIVGNPPPYGFDYVKKDRENGKEGYYKINEEEMKIVGKMFKLADPLEQGYSAREVTRWLTENKIPPQKSGKKWAKSSVLRILRRTDYIGLAYWNKLESIVSKNPKTNQKYLKQRKTGRRLRPKSEWLPIPLPELKARLNKIVPEDRFWRVQRAIDENRAFSKRNTKYEYLFGQLLYCGNCGSPLSRCPCHGKTFYRCGNRNRTFPLPKTCNVKSVSAQTLDSAGWKKICRAVQNRKLIMNQVAKLRKHYRENSTIEADLKAVESKLKNLEREDKRVFAAYKSGIIGLPRLRKEKKERDEKKKSYEKEREDLRKKKEEIIPPELARKSAECYLKQIKKRLKEIGNDFDERQKVVRLLISSGTLNERKLILKGRIPLNLSQVENTTS